MKDQKVHIVAQESQVLAVVKITRRNVDLLAKSCGGISNRDVPEAGGHLVIPALPGENRYGYYGDYLCFDAHRMRWSIRSKAELKQYYNLTERI